MSNLKLSQELKNAHVHKLIKFANEHTNVAQHKAQPHFTFLFFAR